MRANNYSRVTFLGLVNTFDYCHLGGLDSLYRRFAGLLGQNGWRVTFLHYGSHSEYRKEVRNGIDIIYVRDFSAALSIMNQSDGPVVVNAVCRSDRLRFVRYRWKHRRKRFHMVYSVFPENMLRRNLYLLESIVYPYNGIGICLSKRLTEAVRRRRNNALFVLPPVPEPFFASPDQKPSNAPITVTFLGRLDPAKGVKDFLSIAKHFRQDKRFRFRVSGYSWPRARASQRLHDELSDATWIDYSVRDHDSWSESADEEVVELLRTTDILILPYKRLSSTVDMPLLLLEGMAASCCVLVPALGDIPSLYGASSPFVIHGKDFVPQAINVLKNAHDLLLTERRRVSERVDELPIREDQVASILQRILAEHEPPKRS